MITMMYRGGRYRVEKRHNGALWVEAKPGISTFAAVMPDEESARRWLGDRGLRKSKACQLLAAELIPITMP